MRDLAVPNEYNAVTSYIMFRASYRLNFFGTRASRMGGMMGGMPMGGMPMGGGGRGGNRGGARGGGMPMGGMPMGGGFGGPGMF